MSVIIYKEANKEYSTLAKMKVGQYAKIVDNFPNFEKYKDLIIVKIDHKLVVSLNGEEWWIDVRNNDIGVEIIPVGTQILVTVE